MTKSNIFAVRYVHKVNGTWTCRVCSRPTTPPKDEHGNGYHLNEGDLKACEAILDER